MSEAQFWSNEIPREQLAYCAGLFDGEGSVGIARTQRLGLPAGYELTTTIAMTATQSIAMCASVFGGRVRKVAAKQCHHQDHYVWNRNGAAACRFLAAIRPFLLVKGPEADVGIGFWQTWHRSTPSIITYARAEQAEQARQKLLTLRVNHRPGRPRRKLAAMPAALPPLG